ncbi:MAG: hypothetical protein ACKPE3_09100 [Sphaerospermopsis kisseleviana]
MQLIEKKALFTQVSAEESVTASGGDALDAANATAAFLIANSPRVNTLTAVQAAIVLAAALTP